MYRNSIGIVPTTYPLELLDHNPNGKSIGSSIFAQLTAMGAHISQNCPFLPMRDLDHHLTHDSLGTSEPITETAPRSVQPFCTDDRRVSLYFTVVRPLKIAPSRGGFGPPSNT